MANRAGKNVVGLGHHDDVFLGKSSQPMQSRLAHSLRLRATREKKTRTWFVLIDRESFIELFLSFCLFMEE